QARCFHQPLYDRVDDADGDAGLAKNFLSLRLDIARVHFRADQLLDGQAAFSRGLATRRLAHCHLALTWCARVRIVLGDVELLLISQVGLSHPSARLLAHIRNAAAWVWRLCSVRAGAVCVEELALAKRTAAPKLIRKPGKTEKVVR